MWSKVGSVTVPAQQLVAWGATDIINGGSTGRAVYLNLPNSSDVRLDGKIRLAVTDANELNTAVVVEERTERLAASSTGDRTIAVLLPEDFRAAKQDSKLIIYFYPDSATAVTIVYNATSAKVLLPVTVYQ
jgi:hypothetical protein